MEGEVKIVFSSTRGGNRTGINGDGSVKTPKKTPQKNEDEKEGKVRSQMIARNVRSVMNIVSQNLITALNYYYTKRYSLTDNVQAQRDRTIAINLVQKVSSTASSALVGLSAGGIPGAIISIIGSGVKEGISIAMGYDKQAIKIAQMNEQLDYTRLRSGYSLTSGDRGENR